MKTNRCIIRIDEAAINKFVFQMDGFSFTNRYKKVTSSIFHTRRTTYSSFNPLSLPFLRKLYRARRLNYGQNAFQNKVYLKYGMLQFEKHKAVKSEKYSFRLRKKGQMIIVC